MKNEITKRIEKFVYNFKNHTFASRFNETLLILNNYLEMGVKNTILSHRKLNKYTYGKLRVKNFLINNICNFENEHKVIVILVESHCIEEEGNWKNYLKSKNRIASILKANRRMRSLKMLTDDEEMKLYLNEYINRRRFGKRIDYQLQIN